MVGRWNFSHLLVFFVFFVNDEDVKWCQAAAKPWTRGRQLLLQPWRTWTKIYQVQSGTQGKMGQGRICIYMYIYIFRFMCDTDHLVCFRKYMHTNRQFPLRITTWWGHFCPFSGLVSFPRCRKGVMKVLLLHVFWEGNPSKNSVFFQGEFMAFCVRMVVNFIKEKSLQQNEPKIQCNYIKSTKFSN